MFFQEKRGQNKNREKNIARYNYNTPKLRLITNLTPTCLWMGVTSVCIIALIHFMEQKELSLKVNKLRIFKSDNALSCILCCF